MVFWFSCAHCVSLHNLPKVAWLTLLQETFYSQNGSLFSLVYVPEQHVIYQVPFGLFFYPHGLFLHVGFGAFKTVLLLEENHVSHLSTAVKWHTLTSFKGRTAHVTVSIDPPSDGYQLLRLLK